MTLYQNIKNRREELGLTQDQLAERLGYKSRSTIAKIEAGENDLTQSKIVAFAKVLRTSPSYLMGWTDDPTNYAALDLLPVAKHKIPVIGEVHCGRPAFTEEDYIDVVDSEVKADFALKAKGDSMIGAGIEPGDLVFVRKQPTVDNGELAVVLLDGEESAIKRVYKYDNYLTLNAENPAYPPLVFHEGDDKKVEVMGKVVAHMHYYKNRKNKGK